MRPQTLDQWLDWQLRSHPREIELGLDRVRAVWQRLGTPAPARIVITVGGTNGKGSTVAFLESILRAGGYRVGAFTSPHLLLYNERIRVHSVDARDSMLIAAFDRIEHARDETPLTYFEFGTLAALLIFAESNLDVAILEVGLGGRLDAVNIIDADAAIVTTIDLDHQEWLGCDREVIGREKAGIFRAGRPAIVGEPDPPQTLIDDAQSLGAMLFRAGHDYRFEALARGWRWSADEVNLELPHPRLDAPCQRANAAAAIAALYVLRERIEWQPLAVVQGIAEASAPARMQRFAGSPELIVDVAHNPQAARVLADWLHSNPVDGRTIAVFGALVDKDVEGIVEPLCAHIDCWLLAGLDAESARGFDVGALQARVAHQAEAPADRCHANVADALDAAFELARGGDRIVAFGSFLVAAVALANASVRARNAN